jgi:hypothetical protein
LRDREAERFSGFEVHDQLKLGGLFDGQVGELGPFSILSTYTARRLAPSTRFGPYVRTAPPSANFLHPEITAPVLGREVGDSLAQKGRQTSGHNDERFDAHLHRRLERHVEVVWPPHLQRLKRQTACGTSDFRKIVVDVAGVPENAQPGEAGHHLPEQLNALRGEFIKNETHSGKIAARPGQAGHELRTDRVRARRLLEGQRDVASNPEQDVNVQAHQLGRQL